jgi:hypothetical protein
VQVAAALALAQAVPQAPQCAVLVCVLTSHPLAALLSQLAKPALQAPTVHCEAAHTAVPLLTAHARPHPPQLPALLRVSTSQPLLASPSQSAKPAVQVSAQRPEAHAGTALSPPMHIVPHAPQWATLDLRSASHPLLAFMSQLPKPSAQRPMVHWLSTHAAVPFGGSHTRPHAPQCPVLVRRSTSQPLLGSMSQSAKPTEQV